MKKIGAIFLISASSLCKAECSDNEELEIPDAKPPRVIEHANAINNFIPKGWRIVETVKDDFNADKEIDTAISIVETDQNKIIKNECFLGPPKFDSNPYAVLVILKQKNGTHKLGASDFNLIPRRYDPVLDQPYSGIKASKGVLQVSYHYWQSAGSWHTSTHTYSFRFQDTCMRLIGQEYYSFHRASGEESRVSTNYNTGKYFEYSYNPETEKSSTKWHKLKKNPIVCLGHVPREDQ